MNKKVSDSQSEPALEAFSAKPDFVNDYAWDLTQPQTGKSIWTDPEALKSLEKTKESLVFAYLVANLNFENIPLKEFLEDFEKKILLACLRMTHGNQKNAAGVLGIKPTAMFEKMRKHHINGQRMKLSEILEAAQSQEKE